MTDTTTYDRFTDAENTGAPLVPEIGCESLAGLEETVFSHRLSGSETQTRSAATTSD